MFFSILIKNASKIVSVLTKKFALLISTWYVLRDAQYNSYVWK